MNNLDERDCILNEDLEKLQKAINSLSKKEYNQKQDAIKNCEAQVKKISVYIESYEIEIENLDKAQITMYCNVLLQVMQFKNKFFFINQQFALVKRQIAFVNIFFLFLLKQNLLQISLYQLLINEIFQWQRIRRIHSEFILQYNDKLGSIKQRFLRLKSELKFTKNEAQKQENLFKGRSDQQPQSLEFMKTQQVIEMGDQLQKDAQKIITDTNLIVQLGNDLADQTKISLDQQIAQLDSMYDKVQETQSVLKRSADKIKYFAKQVYTDKFLICLIALIFIAIIVLIVLSALGLDEGKFITPDQIKGSLASNSSSSMNTSTTSASK